jgi:N-methylhydantoinase B
VIEVLADGIEASVLGERTLTPAHGVAGGGNGDVANFRHWRVDGTSVALSAKSGPHRLRKNERLEMVTAGGGAWGRSTDD